MSNPLYETCLAAATSSEVPGSAGATVSGNSTADPNLFLQCLADAVTESDEELTSMVLQSRDFGRSMYMLYAAALVFLMQAGFAMLCAGAVRRKNLQNTMLKNLLDACGAAIAFWAVGFAFSYGDGDSPNKFIGTTNFFLVGVEDYANWVFQYTFCASSATIVAGTLAERCKMAAYFYYSAMVSGFVYPVVVHALWSNHGFLSPFNENPLMGVGVLDFAGGGVVHLLGGIIAFVATWILGPRRGRFHDVKTGQLLAKPKAIQGHNVGLQLLGTMLLWFGWYGFNGGSALLYDSENTEQISALAVTNTTLAAGAAGITALFGNMMIKRKLNGKVFFDLQLTMNGVLAGLVAITAPCGFIEPWAAIIVGVVAGIIYVGASKLLVRMRIDDAVDAVPVHCVGGLWGMIAVGLFATPEYIEANYGSAEHVGLFHSIFDRFNSVDFTLLGAQLVGIMFIIGWAVGLMVPFFFVLDRLGLFRSDALDEIEGLDNALGGVQEAEQVGEDQLAAFEKRLEKSIKKKVKKSSYGTPSSYSGSRPPMGSIEMSNGSRHSQSGGSTSNGSRGYDRGYTKRGSTGSSFGDSEDEEVR